MTEERRPAGTTNQSASGATAVVEAPRVTDDPAATIAALRAELAAAAPRLQAFSRLEKLARERRRTPETIALQVTIEVLEEEQAERQEAVRALEEASRRHREERDVLLREKEELTEVTDALVERKAHLDDEITVVLEERQDLAGQLAELIDELESIRRDAVRLMGEKARLELQVEGLRSEVAALSEGQALVGRRAAPFVVDDVEADDSAFDAFFEAEVINDKARAWILE